MSEIREKYNVLELVMNSRSLVNETKVHYDRKSDENIIGVSIRGPHRLHHSVKRPTLEVNRVNCIQRECGRI